MTKRSVRRVPREIDPMFFIPEGVDELVYTDAESVLEGQVGEEQEDEDYYVVEDDVDYSDAPVTPDIYGIVSQTIRTSASGSQVVDVVIDVEDIVGAEYEIRRASS